MIISNGTMSKYDSVWQENFYFDIMPSENNNEHVFEICCCVHYDPSFIPSLLDPSFTPPF